MLSGDKREAEPTPPFIWVSYHVLFYFYLESVSSAGEEISPLPVLAEHPRTSEPDLVA